MRLKEKVQTIIRKCDRFQKYLFGKFLNSNFCPNESTENTVELPLPLSCSFRNKKAIREKWECQKLGSLLWILFFSKVLAPQTVTTLNVPWHFPTYLIFCSTCPVVLSRNHSPKHLVCYCQRGTFSWCF